MSEPPTLQSRLARQQQLLVVVGTLAIAGLLMAATQSRHPNQLLLPAALLLAAPAAVLAFEFALMRWLNAAEGILPRLDQIVKAWLGEVVQSARVFGWRQPFRWREETDQSGAHDGATGFVFVHGFFCNRGFWNPWMKRLRRENRPYTAVNLEPVHGSIDRYVPLIDAAVNAVHTGTGKPVHIVCHSMGGLAVRAWLASRGTDAPVARVVTIGTPHHGTWLARFGISHNARQMQIGSRWIQDLEAAEHRIHRALFTCWASDTDNIVFPFSSAHLCGADNRKLTAVAHVAMAFHPEVMSDTLKQASRLDDSHLCDSADQQNQEGTATWR